MTPDELAEFIYTEKERISGAADGNISVPARTDCGAESIDDISALFDA